MGDNLTGNCRKLLNSWTVVTHNGELFCRRCYGFLVNVTQNWQTGKLTNPAVYDDSYRINYGAGDPWQQNLKVQSKNYKKQTKPVISYNDDLTDLNSHCSDTSIDIPTCHTQR